MDQIRTDSSALRTVVAPVEIPARRPGDRPEQGAGLKRADEAASSPTDLRATLSRINASLNEVQRLDASALTADAGLERIGGLINGLRQLVEDRQRGDALPDLIAGTDEILNRVREATAAASRGPVVAPAAEAAGPGAAMSELGSIDAASLLGRAGGQHRELLGLFDAAAAEAAAWRTEIGSYRQREVLPQLTRLNDEVAAAMFASASRGGRGPVEALTPERAAALLRSRPSAGT